MPEFKKLTPDNWNQRDPIGSHFVLIDKATGVQRTPRGDEWAKLILEPQLDDAVPDDVVELFEVARGTLCYGFYFYPLYTLGSEQLYQVMEAAVSHRCEQLRAPKRRKRYAEKLDWLIEHGLIPQDCMVQWQASRHLRNHASHGTQQCIYMPTDGVSGVDITAERINELFTRSPTTAIPSQDPTWGEVIEEARKGDLDLRRALGWAWAVLEAQQQWDGYDAFLVERASRGKLTAGNIQDFAYRYQVSRTIQAESYSKIAEYTNEHLAGEQMPLTKCMELNADLESFLESYGAKKRLPKTFAAKLLWLYQPENWVMHDTLSRKGLRTYLKRGQKRRVDIDFNGVLRQQFGKNEIETVKSLITCFGISYRYPLRVIDKYLLLVGDGLNKSAAWLDWLAWKLKRETEPPLPSEVLPMVQPLLPTA